jgi:hypothetical protein
VEAFTGLYMSTARVDRIMETALVGDPLARAPLECAINEQDQGRIGSQKGRSRATSGGSGGSENGDQTARLRTRW